MDREQPLGQGDAHETMTHVPRTFTPVNHQLTEHGTPDAESAPMQPARSFEFMPQQAMPKHEESATAAPEPAFRSGSFEPDPPANMPPTFSASPLGITPGGMPDDRPIAVVRVLSVKGVEYAFMTFMLWFGAASLIWLLVALVTGEASFQVLSFPLSTLLISLPVFAVLFLRLRKAELADPPLRLDASKRRFSQITQVLAFLTCFFNLTYLVFALISKAGGNYDSSIGKTIAATAVVLIVAGGVLAYYWFDEHKLVRK